MSSSPVGDTNPFEEAWVQQALATSIRESGQATIPGGVPDSRLGGPAGPGTGLAGGAIGSRAEPGANASASGEHSSDIGASWWPSRTPMHSPEEDPALLQALAASAAEAEGDAELQRALQESSQGASQGTSWAEHEDAELQRALRESAASTAEGPAASARKLMGPEGPFFPAGLLNSGNSCFWNALLQALFAATPVFRGALFQLDLEQQREGKMGSNKAPPAAAAGAACGSRHGAARSSSTKEPVEILGLLRDLFAEMDMGLVGAIDAGELYRCIFQSAEEADVSEQLNALFALAARGPGPLKNVCRELFSGDLYEHSKDGKMRRVPMDLCQLDLHITSPGPLDKVLEEHTFDVQGSIERNSYRLPPVLWLNLNRFVYDREAQCGRKRQVRLTFPEVLNAWMLVPPGASWARKLRACAEERARILKQLKANQTELARHSTETSSADAEEVCHRLVEQQETLNGELQRVNEALLRHGAEQELLYQLRAVIVHRGRVDSGHYYAYVKSPRHSSGEWCCLNDANVHVCSAADMRRVCEGRTVEEAKDSGMGGQAVRPAEERAQGVPSSEPPTAIPVAQRAEPAEAVSKEPATPIASPPSRAESSRSVGSTGRPGKQPFWSSLTSMFGCLPRGGVAIATPETEEQLNGSAGEGPEMYPSANEGPKAKPNTHTAGAGSEQLVPSNAPLAAVPAIPSPEPPPRLQPQPQPQRPAGISNLEREKESTAARCLVYVRSTSAHIDSGDGRLVGEVRNRVPAALQERIDARNVEFLQRSAERVAEEFVRCTRRLTQEPVEELDSNGEHLRESLRDELRVAEKVRAEGGMPRARVYLLRACWRMHVPWMPEELCPTATPPDYRMHYGSTAKKLLLDALIKHGQHDVASLIISGNSQTDAFVPREVEDWLIAHNYV